MLPLWLSQQSVRALSPEMLQQVWEQGVATTSCLLREALRLGICMEEPL